MPPTAHTAITVRTTAVNAVSIYGASIYAVFASPAVFTGIFFAVEAAVFLSVMVTTPLACSADTFCVSTLAGSRTVRVKLP